MHKKLWYSILFSIALAISATGLSAEELGDKGKNGAVYLGILIQEDVTDGVSTDLEAYRHFIHSLPAGSEVMIGYARTGSNEIRQKFSSDLTAAAERLRAPGGLPSAAPGSPYQAVKDFVKLFPEGPASKILIFVSDGVDRYGPLDSSPTNNPILTSAVRAAKKRGVEIHTIFAPASLSANNRSLAFTGQDSLNYLAQQTGGEAHFNGTSYITAKAYLDSIPVLPKP